LVLLQKIENERLLTDQPAATDAVDTNRSMRKFGGQFDYRPNSAIDHQRGMKSPFSDREAAGVGHQRRGVSPRIR
jgi:hypothetical protein